MSNKTKEFQDRVCELREEIRESIVELLKENNLTTINLQTNQGGDGMYVVWGDDEGNFYDTPVKSLSLDEGGFSIFVEDNNKNVASTLDYDDLACQHLDWLCDLRGRIIEILKEKSDE